ncbi:MAG: BlaI/MecI/CopY family transcriptional regulator [Lachnospiraceae bacterium]|nr:BlaI/MecI/CopY family transcriptional regulator [Lachnospiraceae bacterium]
MNLSDISAKLTPRDLDVLSVLWDSDRPMTASEITAANPALNKNTVQPVLRKLLKNELVQVADIVYSGTVLSRSYVPSVSRQEVSLYRLSSEYRQLEKDVSKASFVSFLLKTEENQEKFQKDLNELEELLESYRQKERKSE